MAAQWELTARRKEEQGQEGQQEESGNVYMLGSGASRLSQVRG